MLLFVRKFTVQKGNIENNEVTRKWEHLGQCHLTVIRSGRQADQPVNITANSYIPTDFALLTPDS